MTTIRDREKKNTRAKTRCATPECHHRRDAHTPSVGCLVNNCTCPAFTP